MAMNYINYINAGPCIWSQAPEIFCPVCRENFSGTPFTLFATSIFQIETLNQGPNFKKSEHPWIFLNRLFQSYDHVLDHLLYSEKEVEFDSLVSGNPRPGIKACDVTYSV